MKPRVSVIMPVLNGERFIEEAICSIRDQTLADYELIVVDDGSTDSTADRVRPFGRRLRLKYVKHTERRGIASSMNDGVRNAEGDFISFLDHDDAWLPEFLETQVGYLDQHPETGMVHSDFQTIDVAGNVLEPSVALCRNRTRPSGNVFQALFMDSFIVGNSVLIRKECFDRLGLFDETLRWGDYHMWMRIARHYRVDYVPRVLTKYRQHPTQSTRSVTVARREEESVALQAIKKILDLHPEAREEIGQTKIRHRMAILYCDLASTWYGQGAHIDARSAAAKAIRLWPAKWQFYRLYVASLLPRPAAAWITKARARLRSLVRAGKVQASSLDHAASCK